MAETSKGLFRNSDGSWSLKKIGAAVGILSFYGLCWVSVIKDPTSFTTVIDKVGWFSTGLLGLKIGSGIASTVASKTSTTTTTGE